MRHFFDAARAMVTTMRNVFRAPVTVEFPTVIRKRAERYRTSFALLHDEHGEELCIGCLQCERICPSQVISMTQAPKRESKVTGKKRGWVDAFQLDTSACIFCELCVQVCPTDAIIMTQVPDDPVYSREDLVLTMDRLYAHEKLKPPSWGNGTRLMGMQEAPKEEKKPKPAKPAAPVVDAVPVVAAPVVDAVPVVAAPVVDAVVVAVATPDAVAVVAVVATDTGAAVAVVSVDAVAPAPEPSPSPSPAVPDEEAK